MAKTRHRIHDTPPLPYDTSPTPVRTKTGRWRLQKSGGRLLDVDDAGDQMKVPPPGPSVVIPIGGLMNPFSWDEESAHDQ